MGRGGDWSETEGCEQILLADRGTVKEWSTMGAHDGVCKSTSGHRPFLWDKLNAVEVGIPWLLIGEFNCVLRMERSSRSGALSNFGNWVDKNALVNLGYVGSCYTWSHGTSVEIRRTTRLDRALCCDEWRRQFPRAMVRHLSHAYSDHCLIMLDLNGACGERMGERPFRFLAAWMSHEKLFSWMAKEWHWDGDLTCSLKSFAEKLLCWNRDMFDNIHKMKMVLQSRLEGVSRAM